MMQFQFFVLIMLASFGAHAAPSGSYHPVVWVAGMINQNLEYRDTSGGWCDTDGEWVWKFGVPNMSLESIPCLLHALHFESWDNSTGRGVYKPGVEVRPKGGFNASGFEALDYGGVPFLEPPTSDYDEYFLFSRMRSLGFVEDESYFAHGYDWRLSVDGWKATSFPALKDLIERANHLNQGKKVVLTGVSMAAPYLHRFFAWARKQDEAWVDANVHAFVPWNGPFSGSMNDLSAVVAQLSTAYDTPNTVNCPLCIPGLPKGPQEPKKPPSIFETFEATLMDKLLTPVTSSWPSMYLMATRPDYSTSPPTDPPAVTLLNSAIPAQCVKGTGFDTQCGAQGTRNGWNFMDHDYLSPTQCAECFEKHNWQDCKDDFAMTYDGWTGDLCCRKHECPSKTYSASELPTLFRDLGREEEATMMEYALAQDTSSDPGVPTHCIHSYNVRTFTELAFSTNEGMKNPIVTLGDGDGTVEKQSNTACSRWQSTLKTYTVPGASHSGILFVKQAVDVLLAVALDDDEAWQSWTQPSYADMPNILNATFGPFLVEEVGKVQRPLQLNAGKPVEVVSV